MSSEQAEQAPSEETPALLEVQRLDTRIEQLQHQLATLEVRTRLADAQARQAEIGRSLEEAEAARAEVVQRQRRVQGEFDLLEAGVKTKESRLYSGQVRAIRDLEALQVEVKGIRTRQSTLEDQAIEAMLKADGIAGEITELEAKRHAVNEQITVFEAELATESSQINEQLDQTVSERDLAASGADAAALANYDRLRPMFGHRTAVSFDPVRGCDCDIQMPTGEISRIKRCPAGEVLDCAECGRLVLR